MMLPYMEQSPLYNAINFAFLAQWGLGGQVNATAYNTQVNGFLCPSDPAAGKYANNSYRGSIGSTTAVDSYYNGNNGNSTSTGCFTYFNCYGLRDITDGSSNTVAFSEGLAGEQNAIVGRRATSVTGVGGAGSGQYLDASAPSGTQINTNVLNAIAACAAANSISTNPSGNNISHDVAFRWGWGAMSETLFNTVVTPNSNLGKFNSCRVGCGGCGPDDGIFSNAQSYHSGGVNAGMADGSVRFIKDSINMQTWMAIGTRANGEVVSSDAY